MGVEYHRVLVGDDRRVGRGILAIVLLVGGLFTFTGITTAGANLIDRHLGNQTPPQAGAIYTGVSHAGLMVPVTLMIPWTMVIQRRLYGVQGLTLISVVTKFRFDVFGRAFVFIGPLWLTIAVFTYVAPSASRRTGDRVTSSASSSPC